MPCASVTIRLRGLMYVNLANQSVTYVSGTFVTLDSGLNTRLRLGDEPQLYPIMEAKPNERPHTPWMSGTAVEHHFVVYLEMPRDPEPAPDRPKGLIDRRSTPTEQGLRAASACAQINDIHTVEPERSIITSEISRPHEIGLVSSIGHLRREIGILCPFGFIASRTPMGEGMMVQGAIDGP